MHLTIAKVNESIFDGEAVSVTVPATAGEMTILGEHMPLATTLKKGIIVIRLVGGDSKEIPIEDGVLEVRRDGATIIL